MAGQSRTLKLSILADVDQLKKSLNTANNDVESSSNKISDFGKKAGVAFAAAGVAALAYAGKALVEATKNAIADEAAQRNLALTLENTTGATVAQIKAVEQYITQTSLAKGITDDLLRPAFERLTRSTKNTEESQKLLNLALDISAATGKPLEAIANALGKAYDGNTNALGKLGLGLDAAVIKSKNMDLVTAALTENFAGFATQAAETFEGKIARLNIAFDEGKETIGSFVLDAITPMVSSFVNDVVPAIQKFAEEIGPKLQPVIKFLGTYIQEVLLPAFKAIWGFITDFLVPIFSAILTPAIQGLSSAFQKVQKAVGDNTEELKPFLSFMKQVAEFARDTLAPIFGGVLKVAFNIIGSIVAGLVTGFANLFNGIGKVVNAVKAFIKLMTDNPVTRFFGGGDNSKGLRVGGADIGGDMGDPFGSGASGGTPTFGGGIDPRTASGAPLEAYSPAMQAAILRREQLKAETERLRNARESAANARLAATGGLSTAERIVINVNAASIIDEEGFTRAINDAQNNSFFRGTGGATNLVGIA